MTISRYYAKIFSKISRIFCFSTVIFHYFLGFSRVLKGSQGFSRVFKGSQGFSRVLKGSQGFKFKRDPQESQRFSKLFDIKFRFDLFCDVGKVVNRATGFDSFALEIGKNPA